MSDYTKATNFASKDTLPVGDANKKVKGSEIDTEFNAISDAIATKADKNDPSFTGLPLAPTAAAGTSTTQIATTAFVTTADNLKADIASPTFTGTPAAPTAASGTDTTQIATTEFVQDAIEDMNLTATVLTLDTNWTVTGNGTNLDFAYNGTVRMRLSSTGDLTVEGDVTAYGTL